MNCQQCHSHHLPLISLSLLERRLTYVTLIDRWAYIRTQSGDLQGYLFDRRQAGRILQEEWGMVPRAGENELTTCVRRFGRLKGASDERNARSEHITGARMSTYNGHEVILCHLLPFYCSYV